MLMSLSSSSLSTNRRRMTSRPHQRPHGSIKEQPIASITISIWYLVSGTYTELEEFLTYGCHSTPFTPNELMIIVIIAKQKKENYHWFACSGEDNAKMPSFSAAHLEEESTNGPSPHLSSPTGWHGHLIRSVWKFLERVAKRHEAQGEPQMCPMEWLHCNLFIGRENGTWTTQKRDSSSPPREIFIVIIRCASVAAAERLATAAQQHWRKKKYQRSTQCSILCRYNPFSFLCHPGEILMNRWPHSMFVPCHRSTSDPPTGRLAAQELFTFQPRSSHWLLRLLYRGT